jgi:uncharacterized protein (DUF58 family)
MTKIGVVFAAGAVFLYGAGVLLGYPVLVALAVGAVSMLVFAMITVAIRPRVSLRRQVTPDRVTVGEPALGRIEIHNTSRWPSPPFTAVDRIADVAIDLDVGVLAGSGWRAVHYPVPTPRRGRLLLGPLTVERRDPLGLLRRAQRQTGDDLLWVHPRTYPMRPLPVGVVPDYEGRTTENARPGTVTFSSLREYVPGDDPRHIHWRSTARTGTLIVREHVDTTEPTTKVVLDTRAVALEPDAFESAVEIAASVVTSVETTGRPITLHVVGEDLAEVANLGAHSLLDRLAAVGQGADDDPVRLLDLVERVEAGGTLVVVTGAREPGVTTRLAEQRRRFNPVVVVTVLGVADYGTASTHRRPGMSLLAVRSGVEAAGAWNRMVSGDPG